MFKRKSNAFTLIELITTLVIMAILALIVTPLVMSIIRKARITADKRSVDAYGRSIELAISSHLLDTGKFATSIDELTIEYSGNKVECETTQINSDSSVYLSNCKVNNREVTNYTYGTDKSPSYETYSIGDEVTYNGVDYYVLKDSGVKDNVVKLLKATPLTVEEVNTYGGVGTVNNHVNKYTKISVGEAYDNNGYGGVQFYSSDKCGYINNDWITEECTNNYEQSDIKYIVDSWAKEEVPSNLKQARLIKKEEVDTEMTEYDPCHGCGDISQKEVVVHDWMGGYEYWWTMTPYPSGNTHIITIGNDSISSGGIRNDFIVFNIRPVVELYKNDGITRKNSSNN